MATPARMSSDILQRKYCFCTLPLIYDPKRQTEASYNSDMPEKHIFFFKDNYSKRMSFTSEA